MRSSGTDSDGRKGLDNGRRRDKTCISPSPAVCPSLSPHCVLLFFLESCASPPLAGCAFAPPAVISFSSRQSLSFSQLCPFPSPYCVILLLFTVYSPCPDCVSLLLPTVSFSFSRLCPSPSPNCVSLLLPSVSLSSAQVCLSSSPLCSAILLTILPLRHKIHVPRRYLMTGGTFCTFRDGIKGPGKFFFLFLNFFKKLKLECHHTA